MVEVTDRYSAVLVTREAARFARREPTVGVGPGVFPTSVHTSPEVARRLRVYIDSGLPYLGEEAMAAALNCKRGLLHKALVRKPAFRRWRDEQKAAQRASPSPTKPALRIDAAGASEGKRATIPPSILPSKGSDPAVASLYADATAERVDEAVERVVLRAPADKRASVRAALANVMADKTPAEALAALDCLHPAD